MSMEAVRAMGKHSQAEGRVRTVAMALAFFAQRDTNLSWPSDEELMAFASVSKRHLYRSLRALERAREIQRQPRLPGGRRRVYLVDPQGAGQLPLFGSEGATQGTFKGATHGTLEATGNVPFRGGQRATRVRGKGTNGTTEQQQPPPTPPQAGGSTPDLISSLDSPEQAPRVTVADPQPPRRRRRRRDRDSPACLVEPCALAAAPASDRAALHAQWEAFSAQLLQLIPESTFEIWFAGGHLHGDYPMRVALEPTQASWVAGRYGPLIARCVGTDVIVVGCESHPADGSRR